MHPLYCNPTICHAHAMVQVYRTPASVIKGDGCDVIIVGRGVYGAADPAAEAATYARAAWDAYQARVTV
eukprot:m.1258157 g.1258157  ORF g.1258157 m.1258157 type:complete len:69 (+) comp24717_c0_seq2:195-401(+)